MHDEIDETLVVKSEVTPESEEKSYSEILTFLKSLKLEAYHDVLVEHGADKLGQLIYVDDSVIDQLCSAASMKIIHSGVFKRAIRECKINARLNSSENQDRSTSNNKLDQTVNQQLASGNYNTHQDTYAGGHQERRRSYYACEPASYVSNHPTYAQPSLYQLYAAAQATQDGSAYFNRQYQTYVQPDVVIDRQTGNYGSIEDAAVGDLSHPSSNPSSRHDEFMNETVLTDGSYYVSIQDKVVKFPFSVKKLTHIDRIDSERRDQIRKGSQIYGRDDHKRKNNELTPLELFMNEIAFEICLRDFTFMISRQRLLGLVREIVKDNQIQLSSHHHSLNPTFTMYMSNGKSREKAKTVPPSEITETSHVKSIEDEQTDYDIILHHKLHREWPIDVTKERRKYLGRWSCNFDVIDGRLCYSKDNKNRKWICNENQLKSLFEQNHIDPDSGCHYSRESTMEKLCQKYYCKNMNERITKIFLDCDLCRAKFAVPKTNSSKNESSLADKDGISAASSSKGKKRSQVSSDESKQAKKSRKSTPQRLIIPATSSEKVMMSLNNDEPTLVSLNAAPDIDNNLLVTMEVKSDIAVSQPSPQTVEAL